MIRPLWIVLISLVCLGCKNDNGPSRPVASADRSISRLAGSIEDQTAALVELAKASKASEAKGQITLDRLEELAKEIAKSSKPADPVPERIEGKLIQVSAPAKAPVSEAKYGAFTGMIVWGDPANCVPCKDERSVVENNAPAVGLTFGDSPEFDFWFRKPTPEKKAELGGGEPVIEAVENGVVIGPPIIGWRGTRGEWDAIVARHPCKTDPAPVKARPTPDRAFQGSNKLKSESARRFNFPPPDAPPAEDDETDLRYAKARRSGSSFDNITTPSGRKNQRWDDENDDYRPAPRPAPAPVADCSGYSAASCSGGYSATCAGGYSAPTCAGGYSSAATCAGGSYSTALNCSGGYTYSAPVYAAASCSGGYSYSTPAYSYPAYSYSYPSIGFSAGWGGGWGGGHYCNPYTGICY